jgi:Uncharacterized protein conserved in bacteria (DUF2188)
MREVVRVQPCEEGWRMTVDDQPGSVYRTQREAVSAGRRLARSWKLEFVLYGSDGVLRDRILYGRETSHLPATEL